MTVSTVSSYEECGGDMKVVSQIMSSSAYVAVALDVGTRFIGFALLDSRVGVVLPLSDADRFSEKIGDVISHIIKSHNPDFFVFGLPINLDGERGEECTQVLKFYDIFITFTKIPVVMYDERYTSSLANLMMKGVSNDKRCRYKKGTGTKNHSVAASLILEGFIEKHRGFESF